MTETRPLKIAGRLFFLAAIVLMCVLAGLLLSGQTAEQFQVRMGVICVLFMMSAFMYLTADYSEIFFVNAKKEENV